MKTKRFVRGRLTPVDLAAAVLFVLVAVCLYFTARTGFGSVDESFYFTQPMRWLMGDRPLIDDWHFEQLNCFLQLLPYWLFRTVTGSTEGVILFMRFLALGVALILYPFFYLRFRRYGVWGLLAVALFSLYIPLTILTLNYYTMSLNGLLVVCALLFTGREKKRPALLCFTGIVFACVVVSEPFVSAVYFIWTALVAVRAIRNKKGKPFADGFAFILAPREWLFITAGIVLTAVVFLIWLLFRSPLSGIFETLPEMLNDTEYAVGETAGSSIFQPGKFWEVLRYFGVAPPLGGIAVLILAVVFRKTGKLLRYRGVLLGAACACLAGAFVSAAFLTSRISYLRGGYAPTVLYYYYFQHAPMLLFGPVCWALCEKPDRRLGCMLLLSLGGSAMIDLASEIVLGYGGAVAMPAALICFGTVLRELKRSSSAGKAPEPDRTPSPRLVKPAVAVLLASLILWEGFGVYSHVFYPVVEGIANVDEDRAIVETAARGPLKGIRTTRRINGIYEDILSDLDVIKAGEDGPVYITKLVSYLYLYLERPIGSYYGWYVESESETRQLRYWELHPEKRPVWIYLPEYDFTYQSYRDNPMTENWQAEKLAFLQTLCDCDVIPGRAGLILHVKSWKPLD